MKIVMIVQQADFLHRAKMPATRFRKSIRRNVRQRNIRLQVVLECRGSKYGSPEHPLMLIEVVALFLRPGVREVASLGRLALRLLSVSMSRERF